VADHDTIVTFRRENKAAIEAAFLQVLLLAKETGLLKVGNVSIDGTKIDANASRAKSLRYDRAKELREKLKADIAALMAQAADADAEGGDPQSLPAEIARREALMAKLAAACARLEAQAKAEAEAATPAYEEKRAKDEKNGRKGRKPEPPADSDDHAHAFRNIDARAFRYFNAHPWSDVGLVDKPVQSSFVKSA
jgi:ElaB/YqjD/DUF883 family membrane-anchored ribosome-binding protein